MEPSGGLDFFVSLGGGGQQRDRFYLGLFFFFFGSEEAQNERGATRVFNIYRLVVMIDAG